MRVQLESEGAAGKPEQAKDLCTILHFLPFSILWLGAHQHILPEPPLYTYASVALCS